MGRFLLVCLAGALGTGARYLVTLSAARALGTAWPWGTFFVNLAGCFLMMLVAELALRTTHVPETARLVLTTGFMGGLTTYSSYNYELLKLAQERAWTTAAGYFGATFAGALAAGLLGLWLARRIALGV